MSFKLSRLRAGEWVIGGSALALLVILFVVPWFGLPATYARAAAHLGAASSFSGWESMSVIRWFVLLLGLGGMLCWYLQGRCLAPALPVCAVLLESALALAAVAGLYYRVIIAGPVVPVAHDDPAAFAGLALAVAVLAGCYVSLRADQAPTAGSVVEIERLRVAPPRGTH
ncbi:MAG TPA: hypothetical protein VFP55_03165 [Solirubrobacteraceae bacterium]|nr:hypothetical protein [Solirubrobacteraceae bacterium]